MLAARSSVATGLVPPGSRNEKRRRFGPTTCSELTITGYTVGSPDAAGADPEEAGLGLTLGFPADVQAASRATSARRTAVRRVRRRGKRRMRQG
jgi:hypothetical protein